MKKIILLAITLIMLTGCTNKKEVSSLDEAYFQIGEKISNKEEIDIKYIRNLVSGYEYEGRDEFEVESTSYKEESHTFIDKNDELTIVEVINDSPDKNDFSIYYTKNNKDNEITIDYSFDKENDYMEKNLERYGFSMKSSDVVNHQDMLSKINIDNGDLYELYLVISNDIGTNKELTIDDINSMTDVHPSYEEYENDYVMAPDVVNMVDYVYEKNNEYMTVQYIKEFDAIYSVSFGGSKGGALLTNDNTLLGDENVRTGIIYTLNDFEEQRNLLN